MDANQRRLLLENQRKKLEVQLQKDLNELKAKGKVDISLEKFVTKSEDKASKLAAETVGLVHLDQFQKIKESTLVASPVPEPSPEELAKQNRKVKDRLSKLSFTLDDDDEEEEEDEKREEGSDAKRIRLGADPTVALLEKEVEADREREARQKRELAEAEKLAKEESAKKQAIKLNCSFFDGTDRRFMIDGLKGDTIAQLLEKAQSLFPPLKGSLVSSLLLVKENIILPHDMTVYDFVSRKAYVRHTLIFDFAEDEAGIHIDSSKNCKIVVKSYFERNRHVYPAKQWVHFDPAKHFPLN